MKFGTLHSAFWDIGMRQVDVLGEIVDRMVFAERCGYYASWTTEHHFANDPDYLPFDWEEGRFHAYDLVPDALTLLTYVAAKTTRLRLGTGVLCLPYHHPMQAAERIAMLDVMSGGRVELGIGRGGGFRAPRVYEVPAKPEDEQARLLEQLDILLGAWTGKPFAYDGAYFRFKEVAVVPAPLQRPHPPVYLATFSERLIEYAATRGLSYSSATGTWGLAGVPNHTASHARYAERAAAAGHDLSNTLFPNTLFLFCADSNAEAEDVASRSLEVYSAQAEAHYERQRYGEVAQPGLNSLTAGPGAKASMDDIRAVIKRQLETNLIGTPDTIAQKLTALREQLPMLNYILCLTDAGSPSPQFVRRSMEMFASKVMPRFASATPRAA